MKRSAAEVDRGSAGTSEPRFFYGWVIVAVMTAISGVSMAMAGFNFGLFIRPMGDDLGISRQTFGWAISLRQVASAATSPFLGRVLDRRGARLPLVVGTAVSCAAMVGLANVSSGWQVIALLIGMGVVGMSGPGALAVTVPVAKWFVAKRGRALAIMSIGSPVGAVIFVPVTQLFIGLWGWERAWVLLAVAAAAIIVPLTFFVRRQPEDMGLNPDGADAAVDNPLWGAPVVTEESWTVQRAVRTTTFWRMVAVFSLVMLAMSSVGLHRIPHFTDQGISPGLVSLAAAGDAISATGSTFFIAWLVQRWPSRYVGACGFVVLAGAVFVTIQATTVPMMFASMVLFGSGAGALILLQNFLWADYFGRLHVGAIRGASMPIVLVFSAAGAPIAGYVQDSTGSYDPVWWVGIALMLCGALVLLGTPPPGGARRKRTTGSLATAQAG